ncbi:MAG: hypothetical protein ABL952_08690 [Pyrinomonadaceae bacterium]
MELRGDSHVTGFDKLCRRILGGCETNSQNGGGLFETQWEVFVARLDKNTGRYESRTYCCEDAISINYVG